MTTDPPAGDGDALRAFEEAFHGRVLLPGDGGYEGARRVWNGTIDKRPAVVARPTGVADVITAVNFARENGLLTAIRGGGHNVAGTATCDDGIVIDLSAMRGVAVDPEARTVRAQAGATWGDVDRETQAFGLVTPGGVVSETGIAGLTLGGGYGHTRRKHGLTADNLRSADVVTADGEFLTASEDRHEDLFWALRGGGGNFGVVTAFEYDLHELGPDVMTVGTMYPLEDAPAVIGGWREFVVDAPDEITSDAVPWSVPEGPLFPEALRGTPVVLVTAVYAGPIEEGDAAMGPLRELGTPVFDLGGPESYCRLQQIADPLFPKGDRYYWKSRYLDELSDDAIDVIADYARDRPSPRSPVSIRAQGGAIARVDPTETAVADRESPFLLSIDSTWENPEDDEVNVEWTREFWEAMEPYSSGRLYANFAMLDEGDDAVRRTFGGNYERLVEVKNTYDPENVFRVNQNIRPTAR